MANEEIGYFAAGMIFAFAIQWFDTHKIIIKEKKAKKK